MPENIRMTRRKARKRLSRQPRLACEALEPRLLLAANVMINEIYYDPPDKSVPAEFIELHNAGDAPADLSGSRHQSISETAASSRAALSRIKPSQSPLGATFEPGE